MQHLGEELPEARHHMIDEDKAAQSKSQRKREALALQALAEALVRLPQSQLECLPLDDALREGVVHARALSRGAYRRQLRYLARLLRSSDAEAIGRAHESLERAGDADAARLKRLERWRERLMEEGDAALAKLLDEYPGADTQSIRRLVRNARSERAAGQPPRSYRQLFRLLREL